MDSFFLAEMFKYLYLLFTEKSQLPIDIDDYILTTEAHLLPLSLSTTQSSCQGNVTGRNLDSALTEVHNFINYIGFLSRRRYCVCVKSKTYFNCNDCVPDDRFCLSRRILVLTFLP